MKVVRARDANELVMARQVESIRSMKVTIDGADLIVLREALRSAGRAYRRIYDSILNGLPVGRPVSVPASKEVPQSEESPEKPKPQEKDPLKQGE